MPTYEYACKSCGEHLEVVQSFKDDPLTTCAACGGSLRKVFGSIGIAFKGSGFYRNDSRSSGSPRRSGDSSPAESTASSGSSESSSSSSTGSESSGSSGSGAPSPAAGSSGSGSGSTASNAAAS